MPQTTIQQLLQQVQSKINILDAEILLAHVLNKPREFVLAHPEFKINDLKFKIIKKIFAKRAKGKPIAYLTGHKEFFGLDFIVNKNVLIPRPDTEVMVEEVLKEFKIDDLKFKNAILIDVGTGSGCIPISILKNVNPSPSQGEVQEGVRPKTFAIDISKSALQIAKLNAKKNKVKIKFLHGDLLSPIFKTLKLYNFKTSQLIITANLPYLTTEQYKSSPSIQHEPKLALVANKNGLELYEKMLKEIKRIMNHGAWNKKRVPCSMFHVTCFLEIDPSQTKPIKTLIKKILPTSNIQIIKDLAGLDRIVKICYNG